MKNQQTILIKENLTEQNFSSVISILIEKLKPFANHPYKVIDNEEMEQLVRSIHNNGVLTPIIVRPLANGEYEIVSGHRRVFACKKLGIEEIPAFVKELSREDATPSLSQAIRMKKLSQDGKLNMNTIFDIMTEEKPNQKETVKIQREKLDKYFWRNVSVSQIEDTIIRLLEQERIRRLKKRGERDDR